MNERTLSLLLDPPEAWRDRVAVDDGETSWTYGELHARANRAAHWLISRGVKAGDVVAIHAERKAPAVVALLATLKAGGAFMFLDAEHSSERLVHQARAAKPVAWLSAATWSSAVGPFEEVFADSWRRLDLLAPDDATRDLPDISPRLDHDLDARAYVTFTSGTTGMPKGIVGSLRPVLHFIDWHVATFGFDADARFSVLSGIAHDPFLRDVLTPLVIGASSHLPASEIRIDPERLAGWMAEQRITVAHLTPSLGELLAFVSRTALPELRHAFFGGEPLQSALLDRLRPRMPNARIVNFYGTTETPQAIAWFDVRDKAAGRQPIGKGIDGVELLLLTDDGRMTSAHGAEGEVCVRSRYLALGYLDGTAGGFATSPLSDDPQDRVYRTGDRGRVLPTGDFEILGRRDHQVKVRGFRVEVEEVEEAIRRCDGIREAAVVLHASSNLLAAFVTVDGDETAAANATANVTPVLRTRLPDYMVPGAVVRLEKLPLTANGKVDRAKLPDVDTAAKEARKQPPADADAPANEAERLVAGVWQAVLGADVVRRHDNFFDLGGHSLNATQVASKLREAFGMDVAVRTVFEAPTVAELAQRLVAARTAGPTDSRAPADPRRARGGQQKGGKGADKPRRGKAAPISRAAVPGGSVTSFWQDAVLAWERRRPPTSTWNFPISIRFEGKVDPGALAEAVAHVLDRQESLRQILVRDGSRAPSLCSAADVRVTNMDLSNASEEEVATFVKSDVNAPFLLDGSPLVRFRLARRGDDVHELHASWHQLVSDAAPTVFCDELLEVYAARVERRADKLSPLAIRFVDYAVAERARVESPEERAKIEDARSRIAGAVPLELPLDRPREGTPSTVGVASSYWLDASEIERLSKMFRTANVSFFMGMSAVASLLLACITRSDDISMLTPYASRVDRPELQALIGRFGNWLPMRSSCAENPTFAELLSRMRGDLLKGFAVADVPASLVYGSEDVFAHDLSRVVLNMPELGKGGPVVRQVGGAKVSIDGGVLDSGCRSELVVMLMRHGPRCWVEIQGSSSFFDQATITSAAERLRAIVRTVELDTRVASLR